LAFHMNSPVGAVYDRAYFLDSMNRAVIDRAYSKAPWLAAQKTWKFGCRLNGIRGLNL